MLPEEKRSWGVIFQAPPQYCYLCGSKLALLKIPIYNTIISLLYKSSFQYELAFYHILIAFHLAYAPFP